MVQTVNVTLDNVSPLISYLPVGGWSEGGPTDPSWQSYNNSTSTVTLMNGATASLAFNGTTVWVYGAKRRNHGTYITTLDTITYNDTGNADSDVFQQVLFAGKPLDPIQHTVTLTDTGTVSAQQYLDIDFIVYQVGVPDEYVRVTTEDTDTNSFQFSSSGWDENPTSVSSYSGSTGHATSTPGAYVTFTFEGALVEIYGAVGPDHGNYTVQLDDGPSVTYNATKTNTVTQVLLFQDSSFVPGKHQVKISNVQTTGQVLTIDYATVYGQRPSSASSFGGATIGGVAVGGCAAILIFLFCVFLWWRRRQRRRLRATLPPEVPPHTANFGTGPVLHHTPSLPAVVVPEQRYPSLTSASSDLIHLQPISTPSPPQSDSSTSNDSRSRLILHNPSPATSIIGGGSPGADGVQGSLHAILAASGLVPNQQPVASGSRPLPQPGQAISPISANTLVLAPVFGNDLRNVRMQVEGRSQDFGPVTFIPDAEHHGNQLPPDYYQAIQPFPGTQPQSPQQ